MAKRAGCGSYQKRLRDWVKYSDELPGPMLIKVAFMCSRGTAYRLHRWALRNLTV